MKYIAMTAIALAAIVIGVLAVTKILPTKEDFLLVSQIIVFSVGGLLIVTWLLSLRPKAIPFPIPGLHSCHRCKSVHDTYGHFCPSCVQQIKEDSSKP